MTLTLGETYNAACSVSGGHPDTYNLTLTCPGGDPVTLTQGRSVSTGPVPVSTHLHNQSCLCVATHVSGGYTHNTASVLVLVISE